MVQFILMFTGVLFLSAIFINGFYNTARGEWVVHPDESTTYEGMIFKFWSKWLQRHNIEERYYERAELFKKVGEVGVPKDLIKTIGDDFVDISISSMDVAVIISRIATPFVGVLTLKLPNGDVRMKVYQKFKKYILPEWFRMPMGGCITCMSSVFGTICWIFWYLVATRLDAQQVHGAVHNFIELSWKAKTGLWIFFCISLAWANEFIFNVNQKLKR